MLEGGHLLIYIRLISINSYNFQRWISRLLYRWRMQQTAIRIATCGICESFYFRTHIAPLSGILVWVSFYLFLRLAFIVTLFTPFLQIDMANSCVIHNYWPHIKEGYPLNLSI